MERIRTSASGRLLEELDQLPSYELRLFIDNVVATVLNLYQFKNRCNPTHPLSYPKLTMPVLANGRNRIRLALNNLRR
jgi:hypothetical protein